MAYDHGQRAHIRAALDRKSGKNVWDEETSSLVHYLMGLRASLYYERLPLEDMRSIVDEWKSEAKARQPNRETTMSGMNTEPRVYAAAAQLVAAGVDGSLPEARRMAVLEALVDTWGLSVLMYDLSRLCDSKATACVVATDLVDAKHWASVARTFACIGNSYQVGVS